MSFFKRVGILSILGICLLGSVFALPPAPTPEIVSDTPVVAGVGSQFLASTIVSVMSDTIGDIFAAGEIVTIDSVINGDVRGAGQTVTVNKTIQDDARLAGRTIQVLAPIQGELRAAGETIDIQADVLYPSRIYGQTVIISASVPAGSLIEGQTVTINTPLVGPLTINAESVIFGENGTIKGSTTTNNSALSQTLSNAGAQVLVKKSETTSARTDSKKEKGFHFPTRSTISILIFSLLFLYFLPNFSSRAAQVLKANPRESFGRGALFLIATPIVSLILLLTVIGAPIAGLLIAIWILTLVFIKVFIVVYGIQLVKLYDERFGSGVYLYGAVILASVLMAIMPGIITFILGCFALGAGAQNDFRLFKEIA